MSMLPRCMSSLGPVVAEEEDVPAMRDVALVVIGGIGYDDGIDESADRYVWLELDGE